MQEPRCPRCGNLLGSNVEFCPACGYEFLPHRPRIRCRHCGHRIRADSIICPRCGLAPRLSPLRFPELSPHARRAGAAALAVLLVLCLGWVAFRAISTGVLLRALGLGPGAPPTEAVQVLLVVATPVSPIPGLAPTVRPSSTPRVSPTPTRRGEPAPTIAPTALVLPSGQYRSPQIVNPPDATVYTGRNASIVLEWQPVSAGGLKENEWYRISISYPDRNGKPVEQIRWSKETHWTVLSEWWSDLSPDVRTVRWNVTVMRIQGGDPFASMNNTAASAPSVTRTFVWN